ncbi:addiction module protein [Candidatus Peregrinibacteria bacterium CG10_big_fil_rev_8_21_14_0_10_49_10]|nr:MAG: addiction module protein [Candidatus Peregrinibacteria bacterium CG10_big_fil_rev_8_21_14_0_10_49_10]
MPYNIPTLPLTDNLETPIVLKKAIQANKALAELKGVAQTMPNQALLISTLSIQESKDSSEVESIVTTHDELFRYDRKFDDSSAATKEVYRYREALFFGYEKIRSKPITGNLLIDIVKILTERDVGFRNAPGTTLKNPRTGEVVYTPPQDHTEIIKHMNNLDVFLNTKREAGLDPLVSMAIIHHQFESIHPFFDGNGRVGRILNILYLIDNQLLDIPILYLSRYITQNKSEYYRLLQVVRDEDVWEEWILFMLSAVEHTAQQTIVTIESIKTLMRNYKKVLKENAPRIYSHELINNIFSHPYTKIEYIVEDTNVSRITASKYLKQLEQLGLLRMEKYKNTNYYINDQLLQLFTAL